MKGTPLKHSIPLLFLTKTGVSITNIVFDEKIPLYFEIQFSIYIFLSVVRKFSIFILLYFSEVIENFDAHFLEKS